MQARFFFPGGLDPVLDRCPGDKDPVVTPQVPTCRSIRQSVFDDHAYGRLLHAVRITAPWERQVGHVGVEGASAAGATEFGVGNHDVDRAAGAGIAEIMEGPGCHVTARRRASAARTGATPRVTSAALDMRGRQVFHPRDAFGGIRDIVAWPIHNALLLIKPPIITAVLRSEERIFYHFVATVSK